MSLQNMLRNLRKQRGLSQEKLAEVIGVSRQAVAKWENGQSYPEVDKLIELSNFFKVSIDKIVKDSGDACSFCEDRIEENSLDVDIINFLCTAKKATYAGKGTEAVSSRPNSHDLHFADGKLLYIDTYLGGEKFAGEEALWYEGTPFWSMNYIGRIITEGFSGDFLKECLSLVPKEHPYRGPMIYKNGEYSYHCVVNGEFEWFSGYEEIFYNEIKVYECTFHGGYIK